MEMNGYDLFVHPRREARDSPALRMNDMMHRGSRSMTCLGLVDCQFLLEQGRRHLRSQSDIGTTSIFFRFSPAHNVVQAAYSEDP